MAVHVASEKDLPRIVDWMLQRSTSRGHQWVLEPTGGDEGARQTLVQWIVHTTFDVGIVVVDDDGRAIGGRPSVPARRTLRRLARGTVPRRPSATIGRWQYPAAMPNAVHERLYRFAQTIELLTPPGRIARVSIGLDVGDAASEDLWSGWAAQVSPDPTLAITVGAEQGQHLVAQGFQRVAERHVRGAPALAVTSWRHD